MTLTVRVSESKSSIVNAGSPRSMTRTRAALISSRIRASARLQTKLEMDYQLKRLLTVTQDMETYSHTCLANVCPVAHALVKVIPARCTKMVPMLGEVPLKLMYSRYVSNVLQCNRSQCSQMLGDYIWKSPPWRGITIVTVGCTCVSLFSLSHVLTF